MQSESDEAVNQDGDIGLFGNVEDEEEGQTGNDPRKGFEPAGATEKETWGEEEGERVENVDTTEQRV